VVNHDDMRCRCYGVDRRTPCERDATQEDGRCDMCRCPHGGCDCHGDDERFYPALWYEEPMVWIAWFMEAQAEMVQCKGIQIHERMKDEMKDEMREEVSE
jgi:hypothetical protein